MTLRLGARLVAVLLPATLLLPASAHAEKVVFDDAVGDVVSAVDDRGPRPDRAGTGVRGRGRGADGRCPRREPPAREREFRALERDPFHITVVRVKTPDGTFDVVVERLGGKPIATIVRGRKDVECRGLAAKVDLGEDTVTTSLPTSCVDAPRWVQVGVGAVAIGAVEGQPDEVAAYADDAVRVGEIRDRIAPVRRSAAADRRAGPPLEAARVPSSRRSGCQPGAGGVWWEA